MKAIKHTIFTLMVATFMSCGGGISEQTADAKGFGEMEKELKSEFGENAYYTDLSVGYTKGIGYWIGTTVTSKPESLKMGEWNMSQDSWTQTSEVTLEVPEGSKASEFMFQLNDEISLTQLGELVEKSIAQLKKEKNIENPVLSLAHIVFPDNGDIAEATYNVQLKPENGGTSYNFIYALNGELSDMDY